MTLGDMKLLCKYSRKINILCTLMTTGSCRKVRNARKVLKCPFRADTVEGLCEAEALPQADSNKGLVSAVEPEIIYEGPS